MVRSWFALALVNSEFRIVGEAATTAEGDALLERLRPDVLAVDYWLPDGNGIDLLCELRRRGARTPAILMTAHGEEGFNERARECGAQGTLLKTGDATALLNALRKVAAGDTAFDFRHPRRAPGQTALSPRERDVLRLIANGATNRQVAEALAIGDETVKTLLARSFVKLGAGRRAEAVSRAHQLGLL